MDQWQIRVSPWIIKDGNYPHFFVSQVTQFAIELGLTKLVASPTIPKSAYATLPSEYQITGEVVYLFERTYVLDFGVLAYQETKRMPEAIKMGAQVTGEIMLEIDPYFYKAYLYKLPGIPPLIYTWRVDKIVEEASPTLYRVENGRGIISVDKSKTEYKEVERTAEEPSNMMVDYIMHCTIVGEPQWQRNKI